MRQGENILCLKTRVSRIHVVGSVFTDALIKHRTEHPGEDMAAVCELHYVSMEVLQNINTSDIIMTENEDGGAACHLDRQIRT